MHICKRAAVGQAECSWLISWWNSCSIFRKWLGFFEGKCYSPPLLILRASNIKIISLSAYFSFLFFFFFENLHLEFSNFSYGYRNVGLGNITMDCWTNIKYFLKEILVSLIWLLINELFQDVKLNHIWFWLYRLKWVLIKRNDRIAPMVKKLISVLTYKKRWTSNALKFIFQIFFFLLGYFKPLFYILFAYTESKQLRE